VMALTPYFALFLLPLGVVVLYLHSTRYCTSMYIRKSEIFRTSSVLEVNMYVQYHMYVL
jgi:hypothetical protein